MLDSMNRTELEHELEDFDDDTIVVIGANYGDRAQTTQAIPATGVNEVYLQTTGYSDSGYKIVEEGEQKDSATPALTLNFNLFCSIDDSLTKKELLQELQGNDNDLPLVMGADYGDRCNTTQAIAVTEVNEAYLKPSSYSESGYKVVMDGEQEEGATKVLILNYGIIDY